MLSSPVKISADGQADRRTLVKHYAPDLSMGGHYNISQMIVSIFGRVEFLIG